MKWEKDSGGGEREGIGEDKSIKKLVYVVHGIQS